MEKVEGVLDEVVSLFIRPERNMYSVQQLGPSNVVFGSLAYKRTDLEVISPQQ